MKLNRLVEGVAGREDELVLTKNGRPIAAIVSIATYEGWKETEAVKGDLELLDEIQRGLSRLRRRRKRYSFEEVFGEPIE